MNALDVAHAVVEVASEKFASDIVLLDVRTLSSLSDYLVIVNGESNRQLEAIAEEIVRGMKRSEVKLSHREGTAVSGWILLDFIDVIVHIFAPAERAYYKLDEMWSAAHSVMRLA